MNKENIGDHEYSLKCNISMICQPSLALEKQEIDPIILEVDKDIQSNYLQEDCRLQFTEESQLVKERTNRSQTLKKSKDDSFKQKHNENKDKKFYIFSCIVGSCVSLAIAYL